MSAERILERGLRARARPPSCVLVFMALACVALAAARAATPAQPALAPVEVGQSMSAALQSLQHSGLEIIYSSALVPSDLKVTVKPGPGDARAQAREILAPHSLDLRPVAPGLYAVVRAAPSRRGAPPSSVVTLEGPPHAADSAPLRDVIISGAREDEGPPGISTAALLDRAQIDAQPGLREDVFRGAGRIPGITLNGLSAAPHVRGGGADETLALVDGFPIRQPYHLSGYQSLFSLIDPQLISSMDVYTGGFPARYGSRMSGVFDMRLTDGYGESTRGAGASFFNANVRGSDTVYGADNWDWLGMARVGTLGLVLDAVSPSVGEPSYGDFVGRLRWADSADRAIALYFIGSRDSLGINSDRNAEHAQVDSHTYYTWLRGEQRWGNGSQLTVWLGNSQLTSTRNGVLNDANISSGMLADERRATIWDVRTRYTLPVGSNQEFQFGTEWTAGSADYDYHSEVTFTPEIAQLFGKPLRTTNTFDANPFVHGVSAFLSHRWDISSVLTTEIGLRVAREYGFGLDPEGLIDPRFAVRWAVRPDTQVRVQWGRFHQSDEVNELQVQDGVTAFDRPQRSDHLILGLDHQLPSGVALRAEAFSKRQLDPRVHFENLFDELALLPELEPDRVRVAPHSSELRGVELSAELRGRPLSWWASYTWARAIDDIGGADVPRSWDQRNAVTLGADWSRGRWDMALAGTGHSGWPITAFTTDAAGHATLGARSGERLGTFFSVDMRLRYHWLLERSDLSLALEVTNALDHDNSCCRELVATPNPDGTTTFSTRPVDWLPLIPSLSIQWSR